jgi:hypothetical protein
MPEPKLTICVPVYNGEKTIGRLLESLTSQTMEDIRILVSDNDSTDSTGRICRNLASRDSRIVYSKNPSNLGAQFNAFHIFYGHNSPYTAYAAADLIWKPEFAAKCVDILDNHPDALIAYPACEFIDEDRNVQEVYYDKESFDGDSPGERFLNIIKHLGWNTPYLGVMRQFETLSIFTWLNYILSDELSLDNLFVACVALNGKIIQIPDPLLQRIKGEHQSGQMKYGMAQKYHRVAETAKVPTGQGISLPVIEFVANHTKLVACSNLSMEEKDNLVRPTIEAILGRYQGWIHFELNRAITLIARGHFRQGWEDDIKDANKEEVDRKRYNHLDFVYVTDLLQKLEYAITLMPRFPSLHFARAVLYNAIGRNKEAQLSLIEQLALQPGHEPAKHFLASLTKKVA